MICDQVETFGFMFLEPTRLQPIRLVGLGAETRTTDYFFENRDRIGQGYLFQYTLGGKGEMRVGQETRELLPGDGFLLPLPSDSSYGLTREQEPWSFLWIMLSGPTAEGICGEIREKYGSRLHLKEESSAIRMLQHIYSLSKSGQVSSSVASQELAFSFLCRLADTLEKPEESVSSLAEKAREIIEENYASLQGVSDIALRLGVTQEHLSRSFRKTTGEQLIDVLTRTRLNHAVELLREGTLRLDEIAAKCGFSSGNYLGKVFKRYIGISPKVFQNDPVYGSHSSIVIFH